jgi:hypothetical protein
VTRGKEEEEAARTRALHKLRTRGLEAAIDALIDVAENKRAPANSRAAAGSSLVRANGLFSTSTDDPQKELHEMTAAELKALGDRLERERDAALALAGTEGCNPFD